MSSNKDGVASASDASSPSQPRKIEFHLARKPFPSFSNTCNFKLETLNPSSSSSPSTSSQYPPSSNPKKPDSSEFLDAAFDLEFGFRIPFQRIGAGLENLGNTCFLNSVIQCLTYTEPLAAYLQSGKHQNTCRVAGFCALCAIQKHVSRALQSTGRILAPKDLVSNLRCISRNFRNARQEDAHEYMVHLLESMHKCCLPSGVPAQSPGAYEKSLVHKIFGGRLRSQVKCLQCSYCSNTFDPFLDLSLEILKADSVSKALNHFTAAEQLDGGERQYKCERCKQKVRALKQLTVYKAPYVLTIHLKRFRHFAGQKIDKKVHFGSTLDLKPFVSGSYEGDLTYTLYGVLVHAGWSTHSGHYYCFVRTSSGLWYSLDDNRVIQVSERIVMEQKAYMLFYVRDRKNFVSKKAMDIEKEKLMTSMRSASSSCSISGVKSFQNGYADKKSREAIPSGMVLKHPESCNASEVLAQQNTPEIVSSITAASEKELSKKLNGTISLESAVLRKESSLLMKTDVDGIVHSTTKNSDGSDSRSSAKAAEAHVGCNSNREFRTEEDLLSANKLSILSCPPSVAAGVCNSYLACTAAVTNIHDSPHGGKNDTRTKKSVQADTTIQLSSKNGISKEGAPQPMSNIQSKLGTESLSMNGPSSAKSLKSTPRQKLKKKILMSKVVGMHLSTRMLYGASLSFRKRRICKRMKQRKKHVMQEHLLPKDLVSADMGPSTSNRITGSVGSRKKGHSSCDNRQKDASKGGKADYNCNSPIVNSNGELKNRVVSSQTVLSNSKLIEDTSSLPFETKGREFIDSCSKKLKSQLQNGATNAVTRGVEESVVGCWEEIESPPENVESNGRDTLTIGHVLDEWDEEYDRGKRKKVRGLRNRFGGPNVFQEVATKKAKLKTKDTVGATL